jgi:hypothetical protein
MEHKMNWRKRLAKIEQDKLDKLMSDKHVFIIHNLSSRKPYALGVCKHCSERKVFAKYFESESTYHNVISAVNDANNKLMELGRLHKICPNR